MSTTSSKNFTTLYSGSGSVTPQAPYGNANVVGLLAASTDGANTIGNISATGNVSASYFLGNGSQLSGLPATYTNANVAAFLPTYTGNLTANTISASGNIVTAGFFVGNFQGNITGNLTVPGLNTQVLYNNSGNAGASADFTFNDATNVMSVNGNVVAVNYAGSGAALSAITGANVTGTVANAAFATAAGSATTAATANVALVANSVAGANVTGVVAQATQANAANTAATVTGAAQANITSVGTLTSLSASGNITSSGNISGNFILGNGSQLTGITTNYSNANVTSLLAAFGSNSISTTGNISGGNLVGNGSGLTNLTGANVSGTVASANAALYLRDSSNAASFVSVNDTNKVVTLPGGGFISWSGDGVDANTVGSFNMVPGGPVANAYAALTSLNPSNPFANPVNSLGARQTGVNMVYDVYGTHGGAKSLTMDGNGLSTNAVLSSTGNIVTTGNVSGNFILGNGSLLTGIAASYGNADVTSLLAAFGSNTISTTGNVTSGNVSVTGGVTTGFARTGAVLGNPGGAVIVAGKNPSDISTAYFAADGPTGNATIQSYPGTGNIISEWTFDPTGNITMPGPATLGNNKTAILAGNAVLQMDNTSGNITAGNIVTNASQIATVGVQISTPTTAISPARIVMGTGYNGNTGTAVDTGSVGTRVRNSRLAIWDSGLTGNSATQSELSVLNQLEITSNVANASSRINASTVTLHIGGGGAANVVSTNNASAIVAAQNTLLIGTSGNATVGNTTIAQPIATGSAITINAGSTATNAVPHQSAIFNLGGNVGNAVLYSAAAARTTGNAVATNTAVYYVPPFQGNSLVGGSIGAGFRNATTYYGLRVDDDLAQAKLGSLRQYHEFEYQIPTTTGNVVIDKNNGQVQVLTPTGNVTITDYTNFVNSAFVDGVIAQPWQADTVTIIVNQGVTGGYTVTLPTNNVTNGQTLYANGIKTVSNVANSVTLISVTNSRLYVSGTQPAGRSDSVYLTTVSPAFTLA